MTHHLFRHPSVGVGVIAQRPEIPIAEETRSAGNGKGDNNAIAFFYILDSTAQLNDFPHEFMTQN
jgi:hypothetical protein